MLNTTLRVGSQELVPEGDSYRFIIHKVLPQTGYKFCFSIRKTTLDRLISRGKKLEVTFTQYPDISFKYNPIYWRNQGKLKHEVKLYPDSPLALYYYYVDFKGDLTNGREEGRGDTSEKMATGKS